MEPISKPKGKRGFALMTPERRRELARQGGRSVSDEKRSFSQDHGLAAEAGRKGGLAKSKRAKPTYWWRKDMAKFVDKAISLLGFTGKDRVTGFDGVVDSVCFDLYGRVQVVLRPQKLKDDGGIREGVWFDAHRVDISPTRVMTPREFTMLDYSPAEYDHGPADKPTQRA